MKTLSPGTALLALAIVAVVSPHLRGEIRLLAVSTTAGFVPGIPGPGSPATIFCTGLNLTASAPGISVRYADSFQAPIYAAVDLGQYQIVNFQVPWESHAGPPVLSQGSDSVTVAANIAPWGEFFTTADGYAIAVHASDFSLITAQKPAIAGEWIVMYASNLGGVTSPPATGSPATLDRPIPLDPGRPIAWNFTLWLRDPAANELLASNFIGLAPGFVGVYQINVKLPDALPSGDLQIYLQRLRDCGFFFTQGCGRGVLLDISAIARVR